MQKTALDRFETEFHQWLSTYSTAKNVSLDPDTLLQNLKARIPQDHQMRIGAALLNGWLETENKPSPKYFSREFRQACQYWGTMPFQTLPLKWKSRVSIG